MTLGRDRQRPSGSDKYWKRPTRTDRKCQRSKANNKHWGEWQRSDENKLDWQVVTKMDREWQKLTGSDKINFVSVFQCLPLRVGLCWSLLFFVTLCWSLLVTSDICQSWLTFVGLFWTLSFLGLVWMSLSLRLPFGLFCLTPIFSSHVWSLLLSVSLCRSLPTFVTSCQSRQHLSIFVTSCRSLSVFVGLFQPPSLPAKDKDYHYRHRHLTATNLPYIYHRHHPLPPPQPPSPTPPPNDTTRPLHWLWGPEDGVWVVFGSYRHFWSFSNNCVLVVGSGRGCLGGFRVLPALLVFYQ